MAEAKNIPYELGGMFRAGDLAAVPRGKSIRARNVFARPGKRIEARKAWVSDGPATQPVAPARLFVYEREGEEYLVLIGVRDGLPADRLHSYDGSTWTTETTSIGYQIKGGTNHQGQFVYATNGLTSAQKYDSNAVITSAWNPSGTMYGFNMASFIGRVFFADALWVTTNELGSPTLGNMYIDTVADGWVATAATLTSSTASGVTINTLTPTLTTGTCKVQFADIAELQANGWYTFRSDLRNTSATEYIPLTLSLYVSHEMVRGETYTAGQIRVPDTPNGYRYRCTTAGTAAGAMPVFGTTIGGTTTDGTVVWTNEGTDDFVKSEIELLTTSDLAGEWESNAVSGTLNAVAGDTIDIGVRIAWGTAAATSWAIVPIEVGYKDGLDDSDPQKANKGQMVTYGSVTPNFTNKEATRLGNGIGPATMMWTETDKWEVRALNSLRHDETIGPCTAIEATENRLLLCKKHSVWVFQGTAVPDQPLQRERVIRGIGCMNNGSIEVFNGLVYMIGDGEIWELEPSGTHRGLAGEGMREEMFAAATRVANPRLTVDKINKEVYCYTQTGKIYVYNLESDAWTYIDVSTDASGTPDTISDLAYYADTVWAFSDTHGVVKLSSSETLDLGTYNIQHQYELPIIDTVSPQEEVILEGIDLRHKITDTSQSVKVEVSLDGGVTYDKYNTVTAPVATSPGVSTLYIPLWVSSDQVGIRVSHLGETGPAQFTLTGLVAEVQRVGGSFQSPVPSQGAANL